MGNLYCNDIHWTQYYCETAVDSNTLFGQVNGTPCKQKIKEITSELRQHGKISETNVYNWFPNRHARSKRKQQNAACNNHAESEVVDSPKDKKTRPEELFQSQHNSSHQRAEDLCFHSPEISSDLHILDPQITKADKLYPSDSGLRTFRHLSEMSFYDEVLANSRGKKDEEVQGLGGKDC